MSILWFVLGCQWYLSSHWLWTIEKYTRVSLIMHKASVENAGQSLSQNGFPIEMNYSPIHRDEKTYPVRFSSLWAIGADAMKRRKIWERKKKWMYISGQGTFSLYCGNIFSWSLLAMLPDIKWIEGRESLNRCWYKLKASKGLAFCCQEDWCRCTLWLL